LLSFPECHSPHGRPAVVVTNRDDASIEECTCYDDYTRKSSRHLFSDLLSKHIFQLRRKVIDRNALLPGIRSVSQAAGKALRDTPEARIKRVALLSHRSEEWQAIREQFPSLEACLATFLKVLSQRISAAAAIEWKNHRQHHGSLSPRSEEWKDFGGAIRKQLPSLGARFVEVMKLISLKISAVVNGLKQHGVLLSPRSEEWQDFGGAIRKQLPSLKARLVEITSFSLLTIFGGPARFLRAIEHVSGVSNTEWRKFIAAISAVRLPLHSISESLELKKYRGFLLSHQSEEWQDFGVAIRQQLPSLEARFVKIVRFSFIAFFGGPGRILRAIERGWGVSNTQWKELLAAIREGVPRSGMAFKDKLDDEVQPRLEAVPMKSIRMVRKMCKEGSAVPFFC
jgi:hypothetical protein